MKKYLVLLLLIACSGIVFPLSAETFNYTSVSLGYGRFSNNIDGVSESLDGDGYTVDVSYAVRPYIAVIAGYSLSVADVNTAGVDYNANVESTLFGMIIHFSVSEITDLVIGIGFINGKADVSINGGKDREVDADGGVVTIGFRSMVYDSLEINGDVRKNDIQEESSVSFDVGARYYVYESISLDLGYQIDSKDGSNLITVGMTKYF